MARDDPIFYFPYSADETYVAQSFGDMGTACNMPFSMQTIANLPAHLHIRPSSCICEIMVYFRRANAVNAVIFEAPIADHRALWYQNIIVCAEVLKLHTLGARTVILGAYGSYFQSRYSSTQ